MIDLPDKMLLKSRLIKAHTELVGAYDLAVNGSPELRELVGDVAELVNKTKLLRGKL